jgi:pectate lyase
LLLVVVASLTSACGKVKGSVPPPDVFDAGITPDAEVIAVVSDPSGFATQYMDPDGGATTVVTGGADAPATNVYVVTNRQQLLNALLNTQSPTYATDPMTAQNEPKIIYVSGAILGNQLADGTLATADTYRMTPNPNQYDFNLYLKYFDTQYKADLQAMADAGDMTAAAQLALVNSMPGTARTTFSNNQKAQIQFQVPPNTSLLGVSTNARIIDGYLSIDTYSTTFGQTVDSNIIIRNIEFEVPQDYAPAWDPTDTSTGNWNARYDGITIVTGRSIWIDHCTFSDGAHLDSSEPTPFNGKHVQRHDGLIDIEDGSDDITISYCVFRQHDKTTLIGSTGGGTMGQENYETGREHITFFANMWETSVQRAPLARWGEFHLFNNLYRGDLTDPEYPLLYFIGLGTSSSILSESNVFDVGGSSSAAVREGRVFQASGGKLFHDVGSWLGDAPFTDIEAVADQEAGAGASADIGWTPPYPYVVGKTSEGVRGHVLANAGAGRLDIKAPGP